uniref:RNA helicase n=1 Tax=Zooxanthella nutricula TaxID=1333877 RepID=A0A7S2VJF2_9DINO
MSKWWEASADASWAEDSWKGQEADSTWDAKGDQTEATWDGAGNENAATPPPVADAEWGATNWGAGDNADAPPPAREFWDTQEWNKSSGTLSSKEEWELEQNDSLLFDQTGRATAGLNFSKYENVPVDVSGTKANAIPVCKTFQDIYDKFKAFIPEALMDNLKRCGYETPTPVQKFAIPCGLVGRDVMVCAQTGSGKTAAFLVPVIGSMMKNHENPVGGRAEPYEGPLKPDVLVMTPTRELCVQIFEEAQKCCHRTPYRVARVYGGERPKEQMVDLAKGADLLVATPGRLQDFINRGIIDVSEVNVLVLDEADRMLDMGFEPSIREICEKHGMPSKDSRQTMLFSATFPEQCQAMAQEYMYDYVWIAVGVIGGAVETVQQVLAMVEPSKKYEKLIEELDDFYASRSPTDRMLLFVNAKDTAKWLDEQLYEKKFDSGALHGNLTQEERETNLKRFRKGEIDILIATDVAARGLDIENVAVVLNYDMPSETDTYIHRIGRTGRIGNEGKAITFLATNEEDGASCEKLTTLKELVQVMNSSNAKLPDWLDGLIEKTESAQGGGGWSWGGRDARSGQEESKFTGGGDAWSSWGNKNEDGGDATWAKDPWSKDGNSSSW